MSLSVSKNFARVCARFAFLTAAVFALLLAAFPLRAQLNTGRISGAITDQTGGAIAGATVTIVDVARGVNRPLTADSAGLYAAPNLIPGTYTVRVEFMGFQTVERQNVEVGAGSDIRVDVSLQPGQQNQTVTVTESLPIVNTTNAQTGGTLENQVISNIPLNGRNYRWMMAFVPAVTLKPGQGNSSQMTNGSGNYPNFMVDGLYDNTIYTKEPSAGGVSESGDTTLLPLDAIQEVNLVVNPKAEYGWDPGLTISSALKSGTNDLHGSAYAFGRDTSFDARNPYAPTRAPVSFEQFGASLGGRIKKDKLFYFGAYEGQRLSLFSTFQQNAPTTASIGSTSSSIPDAIAAMNVASQPLNTLSLNIAGCDVNNAAIHGTTGAAVAPACAGGNQFGAPGLFNNSTNGTNVTNVFPNNGGSDNGVGKIDYHINDKHQLSGSFYMGNFQEYAVANTTVFTEPWWEELQSVRSEMLRGVWIWTPNSAWLNEARMGWDHSNRPTARGECAGNGTTSDPLGFNSTTGGNGSPNYETSYNFFSGAISCGFPTVTITGFTGQLGFANDRIELDTDVQGADSLSYTRGNHQFKFGTDIRAQYYMGDKTVDSTNGQVGFGATNIAAFGGATPLESFLAGVPSSELIVYADPTRKASFDQIAAFAQDDWRILPKLTLNLGLRWEGATSNHFNLMGNFAPGTPSGMVQGSQLWKFQSDFIPHVGFAWDITGKGTTVVRSSIGFGMQEPNMQDFIGNSSYGGSEPTGAVLYGPNGAAPGGAILQPVGTITSFVVTPAPVTSGGVVVGNQIPWSAGHNLFTAPTTPACGDGLGSVNPTGTPTVAGGANPVNPPTCQLFAINPNLVFPKYLSWNLNIQHAFTSNLSVDIGYVGSHTYDQALALDANAPLPGASGATNEFLRRIYVQNCAPLGTLGSGANPSQCYPWFSKITYLTNVGNINYDGLQTNVTERLSHGVIFSANYTFAKSQGISTGNGISGGAALDNLNPQTNKGPLALDARHHFTLTATYQVPGIKLPGQILQGWAVNGSLDVMAPLPVSAIDSSFDTSGTGEKVDRWTLYGPTQPFNDIFGRAGTIPCYGISGTSKLATASQSPCIKVANAASFPTPCINAANTEGPNGLAQLSAIGCYSVAGSAIVAPVQGTYGNMYPNELRGPGFSQVNFSATKDFKFKERITTQFRFEVFNLFNRTQYGGISLNLGSPSTFGQAKSTPDVAQGTPVTGSGGPRAIQLGLKILF